MTDTYQTTWATYQSAWRDISAEERRALLEQSVSSAGHYLDPTGEAHGLDELGVYIAAFVKSARGSRFANYQFYYHHSQSVANWDMFGPDGTVVIKGASHATYDSDGKLVDITGFFPA